MPATRNPAIPQAEENAIPRAACTECARRKQKCNREWPCNHCQKRKVADKCRFASTGQPAAEKAAKENLRKRRLNQEPSHDSVESDFEEIDSDGIDALGYMPTHVLYGLTSHDDAVKSSSREFIKDPRTFPQLERALQVIPPRPYTDTLVQNFLNNVNYHYYIIYPPSFLEQYQQWWVARSEKRPLGVQWTCLLLMVCACASQYTDVELQRKLELDLGDTIQRLTEQYHEAARELSSTIPIGYSHIINVQQLLHSCYWFKSEARFVECWHVLCSAIREAQELSMHQESKADPMPEFELEIRRRVWCVMDTWDWQISALLGRPMIIDRADCDVGLPSLSLEGSLHSPLTHMKMQSGLIQTLFGRFGLTKNVTAPEDVQEYQDIIKKWIKDFPPPFDVHNPDRSLDKSCPWIVLHRHYIRTMAFSMLLDPIRVFLARAFTVDADESELKIRSNGIDYCLELMISLRGFFDHVYPRDSKFHFVLFCIFDTSTVLCSAILHDQHHTLSRREDVFKAIDDAHTMLQRLRMVTKSARTSYGILSRIVQRLPRPNATPGVEARLNAKRLRANEDADSVEASISEASLAEASGAAPTVGDFTEPARSEVQGIISPPTTASNQSLHSQSLRTVNSPLHFPHVDDARAGGSPAEVSSAGSVSGPAIAFAQEASASNVMPGLAEPSLPFEAYGAPPSYAESQAQSNGFETVNSNPETQLEALPQEVFASISQDDIGELATLWHYEYLDFDFMSNGLDAFSPPPF